MNNFTWNPNECDSNIYNNGKSVCWLVAGKTAIQNFVKTLSETANVKCDWHYAAGIAYIKTLPENIQAVLPYVLDKSWMKQFFVDYNDETENQKTWFTQYGSTFLNAMEG